MQNKFTEVSPRNFDPMLAAELSDEARKAVNAAFDAMSTWRIETVNSSGSSSDHPISTPRRRIRSPCCALAALGHAEQAAAPPSPAMKSRRRIGHPMKLRCG